MCSRNDPNSRSSTRPMAKAGSMTARASGNRGPGQVPVALDQVDRGPDELELRGEGQVRRRAPDEDANEAGLDDPSVVDADIGELLGCQPERNGAPLARRQPHPPEPAQLQNGTRDRRLRIADVELDDLVAMSITGVGDLRGHDDLA